MVACVVRNLLSTASVDIYLKVIVDGRITDVNYAGQLNKESDEERTLTKLKSKIELPS